MKLSEIFSQLTTGELSMLSIGGAEQGVIQESNHQAVLNHINLGLAYIFHRFPLKEGRLKLVLYPDMVSYKLHSRFVDSNAASTELIKYLVDEGSPFMDDLLKVQAVMTQNGDAVSLNDNKDKYSCHTPSTLVLTVPLAVTNQYPDLPDCLKTDYLDIVYRASHPKLEMDFGYMDPEEVEVDLPYPYLEPLLYFVASRCYHPMSMSSEINQGSSYAMKLEQACQRLELTNLAVDQGASNDRLIRNGWV